MKFALNLLTLQLSSFHLVFSSLTDPHINITTMEPVGRNYKRHKVGLFSVSLAEDQQKDFFGREACTQTEVTEISNLQVSTYLFN